MKRNLLIVFLAVFSMLIMSQGYTPSDAEARAGGGRSFGSRGSRSYSRPASPSNAPSPYRAAPRQAQPASPPPFQQPQPAGGFLRSMAGGILGGMLGGMLFRSMGFGGGYGGGGIGFFDIILIGGILYLLYRFIKSRRQQAENSASSGYSTYSAPQQQYGGGYQESYASAKDDLDAGISHIRQMDPSFDERAFCDQVMDSFFRIQGAWMNRDLSSVQNLLTDQIRTNFQDDISRLIRDHQINRLENIAVRNVEISEAWQEHGEDYITVLIYANLLDYTTNDQTGEVVSGSKNEPVKFEEFWTFTRPVGRGAWRLSGIDQK